MQFPFLKLCVFNLSGPSRCKD